LTRLIHGRYNQSVREEKKEKFWFFSCRDRIERKETRFKARKQEEEEEEKDSSERTIRCVRDADVGLGPLEQLALAICQFVLHHKVSTSQSRQ
jgi:hypothetical protein